jgi:hypothetical protein
MMQEEGFAVPTGAGSASPASGGDKYAVSQNQERNNTTYRTNYNSQSSSEGRKSTGSNSRQSRLPPKRKDLESKFFFISRFLSLSVAYFPTVKVSQRTNQLLWLSKVSLRGFDPQRNFAIGRDRKFIYPDANFSK